MNKKLNDRSYLLASPETLVSPPAETTVNELPISSLSWSDFERLCLRLVQENHSIDNCEIYGVAGSKQEGIDIFALKSTDIYDCFQCKRYQKISPGKLDKIIQEFKDGNWYSKSDKFYLCTSLALNTPSLQDKFNTLKSDLKKVGKDLIKWDSVQLNRILKNHSLIVSNFFGNEWCKLFCGESFTSVQQIEIDAITKELVNIKEILTKDKSIDKGKLNSVIENYYDKNYYWIESDKVLMFNKALEEYNNTIVDKREKFIFSQEIIQSIFDLSELKEIVDDWTKDSWSPENLDHLRFIQSGLLAYSCLNKIPKDILQDLKLLNWCPIHHLYFSGHFSGFIREINTSKKLKLDLVKTYKSDRYLFENLTRIINSLKRYLEFNVNELYVEKPRATIVRNLPKNFVVVSTSDELTIRNPQNLEQVYAKLPLDKQLRVSKIEVVRTIDATIIVGINARDCFYWNPEQDLLAHHFYKASEKERLNNIFCKLNEEGKIETTVQIGVKILVFNNFSLDKSYCMDFYLNLIPYKDSFIGTKTNYLNSKGSLVYITDSNFQFTSLITIESIRKSVRESKEINEWLKLSESTEETSFLFDIQNISIQIISHNNEELILLRGSMMGTGVLVLIQLDEKNKFNITNIYHLKESSSIAIDYVDNKKDLNLFCAYLDLQRKDCVFEDLRTKNFKIIESKTITRDRHDSECRDIVGISVGRDGLIYLNEMCNKILVYSTKKLEFTEFEFGEEEVHFIKHFDNRY
ncbi:hypothetical protein ABHQ57_14655 [Tenacibaculum sp. ZH5_bin.1]|uniref:hypothetical protein n=1 Tax=unclassified Tenacibaculum TaxID=2635139 RepID=UPI0036ED3340